MDSYPEAVNLFDIMSTAFQSVLKASHENNITIPSLSDAYTPESDIFYKNRTIGDAARMFHAAALQLVAILIPPERSVMSLANGHFYTAALRVCINSNVTEILREAGAEGLHITQIARRCSMESSKLGRLLRLLTLRHVYKEIRPDVYTNTRMSSVLDSGKSVSNLHKDPFQKHVDTNGWPAIFEIRTEDGPKCSVVLSDNLLDATTGFSEEPHHAPFQRAMHTKDTYWDYLKRPDQTYRLQRFNISQSGWTKHSSVKVVFQAFDWNAMPRNSVVVDVGGGIGSITLQLVKRHPNFKYIVQDLPDVVKQAHSFWEREYPEAILTGQVRLEAHDFFTEQPVKNASIFYLKNVLHDWSDQFAKLILQELRKVAIFSTKLIVEGGLLSYACHEDVDRGSSNIPGSSYDEAPQPLLPNFGAANELPYMVDLIMMTLVNGRERTLGEMRSLLLETGWRIIEVRFQQGSLGSYLLAEVAS